MSNIVTLCIDKKIVDQIDLQRIEGESRSRAISRMLKASLTKETKSNQVRITEEGRQKCDQFRHTDQLEWEETMRRLDGLLTHGK